MNFLFVFRASIVFFIYITFFLLTDCACLLTSSSLLSVVEELLLLVVLIASSTTFNFRLRDDADDVFVVFTLTSTVVVVVVVVNKVVSFSLSIDGDNCCFIAVIVLLQSSVFGCIGGLFSLSLVGEIGLELFDRSSSLFRGIVKRNRLAESVCAGDDDAGGESIIIILDRKQMSSEK